MNFFRRLAITSCAMTSVALSSAGAQVTVTVIAKVSTVVNAVKPRVVTSVIQSGETMTLKYVFDESRGTQTQGCANAAFISPICSSSDKGPVSVTVQVGGHIYSEQDTGSINRVLTCCLPGNSYSSMLGSGGKTIGTGLSVAGWATVTATASSPDFDWRSPFSDSAAKEKESDIGGGVFTIYKNGNPVSFIYFTIQSIVETNSASCPQKPKSATLSVDYTTGSLKAVGTIPQPNILGGTVFFENRDGSFSSNRFTTLNAKVTYSGSDWLALSLGDKNKLASQEVSAGAIPDSHGNASVQYATTLGSGRVNDQVAVVACQSAISPAVPIYEFYPYLNAHNDGALFDIGVSQVDDATYVNFDDLDAAQIQTFFEKVEPGRSVLARLYLIDHAIGVVNSGFYDKNGDGIYHRKEDGAPYCSDWTTSCVPEGTKASAGLSIAAAINQVAIAYDINPKLLIVKLQVEQGVVSATSMQKIGSKNGKPATPQQTDNALNWVMGCGPKTTFLAQVECAAANFRKKYDAAPTVPYFWPVDSNHLNQSIQYEFSPSKAECVDVGRDNKLAPGCVSVGFWIGSAPTYAQYKYTPFINTTQSGGGVQSFERWWFDYDSKGWYQ